MSRSSRDKYPIGNSSTHSTLSDKLLSDDEKAKAEGSLQYADVAGHQPGIADLNSIGRGSFVAYYDGEYGQGHTSSIEIEPDEDKSSIVINANDEGGQGSSDLESGKCEEIYHPYIEDDRSRGCCSYFTYMQLSKLIAGKDAKTINPRTFVIYCFAAVSTVGAAPLSYKAGTTLAGENVFGASLGVFFAAFSYPAFITIVSAVFKAMYRKHSVIKADKVQSSHDVAETEDSSGDIRRNAINGSVAKLLALAENIVVILLSLSAAVQFAYATEVALSGKEESFIRSHDVEALPAFIASLFAYAAMTLVNVAGNVKTKQRLAKNWLDYQNPKTAKLRKELVGYLRAFKALVLRGSSAEITRWMNECRGKAATDIEIVGGQSNQSLAISSQPFLNVEVIQCAVNEYVGEITQEREKADIGKKITGIAGALIGAAAGYAYFAMSYQAVKGYFGEQAAKGRVTLAFALLACAGHAMITSIPLEMWAKGAYLRFADNEYISSYCSTQVAQRRWVSPIATIYGGSATIPILYLTYKFIEQSGISPWFNLFLIPIFLGPWALRTETLKQELNSYISFTDKTSMPLELDKDKLQKAIDDAVGLVELAKVADIKKFSGVLVAVESPRPGSAGSVASVNSQTPLYT